MPRTRIERCYELGLGPIDWCGECKAFQAEAFVSAPANEEVGTLRLKHLCKYRGRMAGADEGSHFLDLTKIKDPVLRRQMGLDDG